MKVIIVGLGRLGTGLALKLEKENHEVTVIDIKEEAINALGKNFSGKKIIGFGFDKATLEKADVTLVDAVIACTNSDEVNVVVARVAKNIYQVPRVIARVYDEQKADIYRRLGIQTIATSQWGIQRASEILSYDHIDNVFELGSGNVQIVRVEIPELMVGYTVRSLESMGEIQVIAINRYGNTFVPVDGELLETSDIIYLSVDSKATSKLKNMLGL